MKAFNYEPEESIANLKKSKEFQQALTKLSEQMGAIFNLSSEEGLRLRNELESDFYIAVQDKKQFDIKETMKSFLGEKEYSKRMKSTSSLSVSEKAKMKWKRLDSDLIMFGIKKERDLIARLIQVARERNHTDNTSLQRAIARAEQSLSVPN